MFNFGLFSSSLPYLVFVAAYVFYFATSILGKESVPGQAGTELAFEISSEVKEDVIHLGDYQVEQAEENAESLQFECFTPRNEHPPEGKGGFSSRLQANQLFSRPPPVCC